MTTINLLAKHRKKLGTKNSRKIRLKNKIPAVIYSKGKKNIHIKIKNNNIHKIYKIKKYIKEKITILIEKKIINVKIKEIQKHPIKNKILHIDFIYQ